MVDAFRDAREAYAWADTFYNQDRVVEIGIGRTEGITPGNMYRIDTVNNNIIWEYAQLRNQGVPRTTAVNQLFNSQAFEKDTLVMMDSLFSLSMKPMEVTLLQLFGVGGFVTSREEVLEDNWKVYPNPARDRIFVQPPRGGNFQEGILCLTDLSGRILRQKVIREAGWLDISGLAPGLFLLRLTNNEGRSAMKKVVIR